ncbi:MAG: hypothetical protein ACREBR_04565 [bacterium]
MYRIQRYHALSVFGDMKIHNYAHAVGIGALHFANPVNRQEIWGYRRIKKNLYYTDFFEGLMKELMNNGLLKLIENDEVRKLRRQDFYVISPRDYDVQLTDKGRECLGMEQIARSGDYSFYKNFDGTLNSVNKLNPGLFGSK